MKNFLRNVQVACAVLLLLDPRPELAAAPEAAQRSIAPLEAVWRDGTRLRRLERQADRAAVLWGREAPAVRQRIRQHLLHRLSGLRVEQKSDYLWLVRLPSGGLGPQRIRRLLEDAGLLEARKVRPVYARAGDDAPYLDSGEIVVQFRAEAAPTDPKAWAREQGLEWVRTLAPGHGFHLLACNADPDCPQQAQALAARPEVLLAYPDWVRPRASKAQTRDFMADPLFSQQWYLQNQGQSGGRPRADITAPAAWDLVGGGRDHVVVVVDTGVETAHPDLAPNIRSDLGLDLVDGDQDPNSTIYHGTAIAGLVAARGGNGIGLCGAAPTAPLAAVRLTPAHSDSNEFFALSHGEGDVAVYVNAWGPQDNGHLEGPGPLADLALQRGVAQGRNGRGAIFVWAGGNGGNHHDNTNYDGFANRPEVITVSATTHTGKAAYYSEPGATNWVNAPGGDSQAALLSTDLTGPAGAAPGDYFFGLIGSSAAAPLVGGVVSLVLDANPTLGWREVKQVLLESADKNDPSDPLWETNGAGRYVHPYYGFGRVNAGRAIERARETWSLPALELLEQDFQAGQAIPDGGTLEIRLQQPHDLTLEYVQLRLDTDHANWGQLGIELQAPSGLISELAAPHPSYGAQLDGGWAFGSARHWGENSSGEWLLRITDHALQASGTLRSARLTLWGHPTEIRELRGQQPEPEAIPALSAIAILAGSAGLLLLAAGFRR